jgi:hypothetical protein
VPAEGNKLKPSGRATRCWYDAMWDGLCYFHRSQEDGHMTDSPSTIPSSEWRLLERLDAEWSVDFSDESRASV